MGQMLTSNQLMHAMPMQKLPRSKKDKEWRESCVYAVAYMGNMRYLNGRTSWQRKQINYNLVNSIFDEEDLKYVLDPYNIKNGVAHNAQPARMRDINLIVNKINSLKGEEMVRPFNFQVVTTNGEGVTERERLASEYILHAAQAEIDKIAGKPVEPKIDPNTGEEIPTTIPGVQKYIKYSMKDIREEWGNSMLEYLTYKEDLLSKFNDGWEHALIAAEEIYYVGIVNGEPKVRVVNPLNCEFDRNPDNPYIEDGDWFREDRWMTAGQILDEYGDLMTEEQRDILASGGIRQGLTNQMFPGYGYTADDIRKYETGNFSSRGRGSTTHYIVRHVAWVSWKQIGFITYPDGSEDVVDETFTLTSEMKDQGITVEWLWVKEIWHGTLVGADMVLGVEPMPNQVVSMDNPHEVKLPYIGYVYNGTNSIQTSVVDLIKPHQYLYNIIWFRLEAEIAKAKGKKFLMDISMIPKSQGLDLDKWINFFDNVGIAFLNSHEEGNGLGQGKTSQFNQFQAIDLTLSQSIGQYISILSKIESLVDRMIGMPPGREGGATTYETAHGVATSQIQSSYITEPLFYRHGNVKRKVLTALLETTKICYPGKKRLNYIANDVMKKATEIDMLKFSMSDYDVFVTNSTKDNQVFAKLDGLAQAAMSSGVATFNDIIKMYRANSIAEVEKLMDASEDKRNQQAQQGDKSKADIEMQKLQFQAQEADKQRAFDAEQNQLEREKDIRVAALKTAGFDTDTADNGQIDVIEQSKLMLDQAKHDSDQIQKTLDRQSQAVENEKDRALKRDELRVKKQIEDKKASVALKNPVSGERKK